MAVEAPPEIVACVRRQLVQRNQQHVAAFSALVADYLACLQRARELQVGRWHIVSLAGAAERFRAIRAARRGLVLTGQAGGGQRAGGDRRAGG